MIEEACKEEKISVISVEWLAFTLQFLNLDEDLQQEPLVSKMGALLYVTIENCKDSEEWLAMKEAYFWFRTEVENGTEFWDDLGNEIEDSYLVEITSKTKFTPRSESELVHQQLRGRREVVKYKQELGEFYREPALYDACGSDAQFEHIRKILNLGRHSWKCVVRPPRCDTLKRTKLMHGNMYKTRTIVTSEGEIDIIGDRERIAVTETRRSWNKRVGREVIDKMKVVRIGIPAPTCFLFENMTKWLEAFVDVAKIEPTHWHGQQILDAKGSLWKDDDEIDRDTCRELEFRLAFSSADLTVIAAAELATVSPQMGWIVSLKRASPVVVQIYPKHFQEVFDKCLLEMLDHDIMRESGIDMTSPDDDEIWDPVQTIHLGIGIYVDNVGKNSGFTPVLGVCVRLTANEM
jgi:Holliday junction resolvase-like predicted endonuclease